MLDELAVREPVDIAAVVSAGFVLDFVILYESLVETWTFFPFRLHAFAVDTETYERLSRLDAPEVEVHRLPGESGDFGTNALRQLDLIEHSGLERCIVCDVDNVFVAETPELFMLLEEVDLVFIGGPPEYVVVTSLWAFRRNERTLEFARKWMEESVGKDFHDASGLPVVLMNPPNPDLKVRVLSRPKPGSSPDFHLSPYCVQPLPRPFYLSKDPHGLGFREAQMGRAKVVHLGTLRGSGTTLSERLKVVLRRFPHASQFLPFYATLAMRAVERLGMVVEGSPEAHLQDRFDQVRVVARGDGLPKLLNERGLLGRGVVVDSPHCEFSEVVLNRWHGKQLVSVNAEDPGDGEAERRLAVHGERSSIWRTSSTEAAEQIEDQSLDFVYLNATHDHASVKLDLELWFDKVRVGGFVAGDSYVEGDLFQGHFGVRSAVNEFFAAQDLRVRTTVFDAPWVSWFVEVGGPPFAWKQPS